MKFYILAIFVVVLLAALTVQASSLSEDAISKRDIPKPTAPVRKRAAFDISKRDIPKPTAPVKKRAALDLSKREAPKPTAPMRKRAAFELSKRNAPKPTAPVRKRVASIFDFPPHIVQG
uniref:Putative secreted protein n=1 Tax=Culex tarsalis TaxID=7177 RepID=A0A1Q3FTS2_CULTA